MSKQVCLRCDWTGDDDLATCPRCGAPLFRSVGSEDPVEDEPEAEPSGPFVAPAPTGRRWIAAALGLAIAAAGTAFVFVSRPFESPAAPATATSAPTVTPDASDRPSPSASPSRDVLSACTGRADGPLEPGQQPPGSSASEAETAEYRFQGTLASSSGEAPVLRPLLIPTARFRVETVAGARRTVLRFPRGRGLELAPTPDVIDGEAYTIEMVFRLDRLNGYRKIVDFSDGSQDCGLYVLDGRLQYYATAEGRPGRIVLGEYVHVVLTREATSRVVGYVDGEPQFAFLDTQAIASFGQGGTIRFFVDDAITGGREASGGIAALIRLYERPLSETEVADLACEEVGGQACD
jgi:hypothetical protein